MEDIDGGLHPAVDGQNLDEDEDGPHTGASKQIAQQSNPVTLGQRDA